MSKRKFKKILKNLLNHAPCMPKNYVFIVQKCYRGYGIKTYKGINVFYMDSPHQIMYCNNVFMTDNEIKQLLNNE